MRPMSASANTAAGMNPARNSAPTDTFAICAITTIIRQGGIKMPIADAADTFATELFGYSQWPDQRISFTTLAGPSMEPLVRVYVYPYSSSGLNRSSASGAYYRVMSTSESWDWQSKMYTMNVEAINIR